MDPTETTETTADAQPLPPPALGEIEARLMVADRLAEFRANVLAVLGLDADDLPTLRSVLDGQLVCEREVAKPVPRRSPLPLTVRQAMTLAANTGVKVVLRLRFRGETVDHVCRVVAHADHWSIDPGLLGAEVGRLRPLYCRVIADVDAANDDDHPFVVSCEPVPKGLAIVPEGEGS